MQWIVPPGDASPCQNSLSSAVCVAGEEGGQLATTQTRGIKSTRGSTLWGTAATPPVFLIGRQWDLHS